MKTKAYEQNCKDQLKPLLKRLQNFTDQCRPDMHEPDGQNISAIVTGFKLDNAYGSDPMTNRGEFTVRLTNEYEEEQWFNLADLIALARFAKL